MLRPTVDWQHEAIEDMERAFRAVVNEIPGYEFKTRAALSEMIFQLVSHAPAVQAMPKKALRNADRIKTMLQFIQEHYAEDISVEQVASSASISPSECLRCFHDMIGTTPNQYLRDQRAQRAAELLCGSGTAGDGNRDAVRFSGRELLCPRLPPGLRLRPDGVSQKSTKGKIKLPPSVP